MQICNYTPAQDLDRLVAISTGMLCCFDGYQNSFHFLLDFFFPKKIFVCISVSLCISHLGQYPCLNHNSTED